MEKKEMEEILKVRETAEKVKTLINKELEMQNGEVYVRDIEFVICLLIEGLYRCIVDEAGKEEAQKNIKTIKEIIEKIESDEP